MRKPGAWSWRAFAGCLFTANPLSTRFFFVDNCGIAAAAISGGRIPFIAAEDGAAVTCNRRFPKKHPEGRNSSLKLPLSLPAERHEVRLGRQDASSGRDPGPRHARHYRKFFGEGR